MWTTTEPAYIISSITLYEPKGELTKRAVSSGGVRLGFGAEEGDLTF